jgi:REP-associated tyrosine transposase
MRYVPFGQPSVTREPAYRISAATRHGVPTFADFASGAAVAAELVLMQTSGIWDVVAWVLLPTRFDAVILLRRGGIDETASTFLAHAGMRVMRIRDLACPVWDGRYTWRPIADDTQLAAAARALLRRPLRAQLTERLADYPFWDSAWVSTASRAAAAPSRPIAGSTAGPTVGSIPSMAPPSAGSGAGADGAPAPAPFPVTPLTPRPAVELR